MNFKPYPFEKLNNLLKNIKTDTTLKSLSLTIGEPQFQTPSFIQEELCDFTSLLKKYPKTSGEDFLRLSIKEFIFKRFDVQLDNDELIPTFGTREVLFNLPQFLLFDKQNPVMAYTNPFYQIYEGAAIASRSKIIHINLLEENCFKPIIDEQILSTCDLVIINFPNNPTASVLTLDELGKWVKLALKYNFILINDECYSEIYTHKAPPSLLEASLHVKNHTFKNILVVNSISKRSSAPGLRSGFVAGDKNILKKYMKYRTYIGCASPLPLQKAAAVAWGNEAHVELLRQKYIKNFQLAKEILDIKVPDVTFYIWLKVNHALEFTCELYKKYNIKVLPGEFLAREDEHDLNPGFDYIRIALVYEPQQIKKALNYIKECLSTWKY